MCKDTLLNVERVLAAAKQCFAEQGASVTMEAIGSRAGVGVGTLYRRFGSRAALVEAVYDAALAQVGEGAAALACHPDPWEALVRWSAAPFGGLAFSSAARVPPARW